MKPSSIRVGQVYANRGAGRVRRQVKGIGLDYRPRDWYSSGPPPDDVGVWYLDSKGREGWLYLKSFASWAGKQVDNLDSVEYN